MKIMIVNSKIKHISKTILWVIRNLLLDFIMYFVIAYMRKYPIHATSAKFKEKQDKKNTISYLRKLVKNILWQTIYNINYTQKCSQLLQ